MDWGRFDSGGDELANDGLGSTRSKRLHLQEPTELQSYYTGHGRGGEGDVRASDSSDRWRPDLAMIGPQRGWKGESRVPNATGVPIRNPPYKTQHTGLLRSTTSGKHSARRKAVGSHFLPRLGQ
jgi:hypothetical protein